jgi:hypothetical protein
MNHLGEKAFIPQNPSKLTSQNFQEPILGQVSLDLKGQLFLEPRHPAKDKHRNNEYLPFLQVPSHMSHGSPSSIPDQKKKKPHDT